MYKSIYIYCIYIPFRYKSNGIHIMYTCIYILYLRNE